MASLNTFTAHSAKPWLAGWYIHVWRCNNMPDSIVVEEWLNSILINWAPFLVTKVLGNPCVHGKYRSDMFNGSYTSRLRLVSLQVTWSKHWSQWRREMSFQRNGSAKSACNRSYPTVHWVFPRMKRACLCSVSSLHVLNYCFSCVFVSTL